MRKLLESKQKENTEDLIIDMYIQTSVCCIKTWRLISAENDLDLAIKLYEKYNLREKIPKREGINLIPKLYLKLWINLQKALIDKGYGKLWEAQDWLEMIMN